jgi:hypothetical protein
VLCRIRRKGDAGAADVSELTAEEIAVVRSAITSFFDRHE